MAEKSPLQCRSILQSYAWLIAMISLLILVGSGIIYFLNQSWAIQAQLGAGVGAVLLLGAVLLRPDAVRTVLTGRPVKYGSNAVVMSLAFISILGLINFLVLKYEWEYDLTETGQFTLSDQTIQILEKVDRPVEVIGFFKNSDTRLNRARDYLERYSHYTHHLTYEFHDPEIEPILAQKYELNNYGLVFVSDNQRYEVSSVDEQTITSGLLRVTSDEEKKVYFIIGHREHNPTDDAQQGYSGVKHALERENYLVENINLAATKAMPADVTVLILAGADHQLLDTEIQLIADWMTSGGKLMVLVDPLEPVPLENVLQEYGLSLGNDFVVEDEHHALVIVGPEGLIPQVIAPLIYQYPYHEITRSLNGFRSFFPFARSIAITNVEDPNKNTWAILNTSQKSWAETDLESTQPEYTPGRDLPGPLHLATAAEDYQSGARVVVFGDAGFVTNQNISPQWANLDLFMNAVNWLAEEEDLISIRPKEPTNRRLFLTPLQSSLTIFTTLIIIPLAVFVAGIGVWWKRR